MNIPTCLPPLNIGHPVTEDGIAFVTLYATKGGIEIVARVYGDTENQADKRAAEIVRGVQGYPEAIRILRRILNAGSGGAECVAARDEAYALIGDQPVATRDSAAIAALRWLLESMANREHDGPAMDKARAVLAQHDGKAGS